MLELEGEQVQLARGGSTALDLVSSSERFDLVLCDMSMPGLSGWQVAREIEQLAPGTPVWLLTGCAQEISPRDPRRELVRGVLPKPLEMDQLRALLSADPEPPSPGPLHPASAA